MTDVLHHGFTSPRADGGDPAQVQPSHWNAGHKFQGGVAGDLLVRDPTDANYGAKWGRPLRAVVFPSNTGSVNDWAPGLVGDTFVQWVGTSNLTVTGLAGGVVGQTVTIANYGSGVLSLVDQSTASAASNRFRLLATSAPTPIAFGGSATFVHNGTVWVLLAHDQGAWITPSFSAGNFVGGGGGSWTLDAGDVQALAYRLSGRTLTLAFFLSATSVVQAGGGPTSLVIASGAWGGFQCATTVLGNFTYDDAATARTVGYWQASASSTNFSLQKITTAQWLAATHTTTVFGNASFPII